MASGYRNLRSIAMRKVYFVLIPLVVLTTAAFTCTDATTPNWPWQVRAHPSVEDNPPGCVHAYSKNVTFEGHFDGVVWPGSIPAVDEGDLYLVLNKPISVCAYHDLPSMPAYVNVSRIAIGAETAAAYNWAMRKWGKDDIRLTGTLNIPASIHARGPLYITVRQFCYRKAGEGTPRTYHCMAGTDWWRTYPKGRQYHLCIGVECVKEYGNLLGSATGENHILEGGAPNANAVAAYGEQALLETRPAGCLSYWPHTVTLRGRLGGVLDAATARGQGQPAVQGVVSMVLSLDQPIAVCAVPKLRLPAFKKIRIVGIGLWSLPAARLLIKKWGDKEVQVVGGLDNSDVLLNSGQTYTVIFTDYQQFCWRGLMDKNEEPFTCIPWNTWIQDVGREVNLVP